MQGRLHHLHEQIARLASALDQVSGISLDGCGALHMPRPGCRLVADLWLLRPSYLQISDLSSTLRLSITNSLEMLSCDPAVSALLLSEAGSASGAALSAFMRVATDGLNASSVDEIGFIVGHVAVVVSDWSGRVDLAERAIGAKLSIELGQARIQSLALSASAQLEQLEQATSQLFAVVEKVGSIVHCCVQTATPARADHRAVHSQQRDIASDVASRELLRALKSFLPWLRTLLQASLDDPSLFASSGMTGCAGWVHVELLVGLHRPGYEKFLKTGDRGVRPISEHIYWLMEDEAVSHVEAVLTGKSTASSAGPAWHQSQVMDRAA